MGFGKGSYNDAVLEKLANSGDGQYVYVDSAAEARRVFVDDLGAMLQFIAKDAKIQVEFSPQTVRRYRLIGYENRAIADKDFRNHAVDAGEVGSGQSATALYEIELTDEGRNGGDLGTVYVRYYDLGTGRVEETATRLERRIIRRHTPESAPRFFLAAAVAEFAEILRGSEHSAGGDLSRVEAVLARVAACLPLDKQVAELLKLVTRAKQLPEAR